METDALTDEISRNFDAFQRMLSFYLATHADRFALLKDGGVVEFFDTPSAADKAGASRFDDGLYSIQQVTAEPVELGVYANAFN